MTDAITTTTQGDVLVVEIDRPPVNALDVETLDALSDTLDKAKPSDPDAIVLTGKGSLFSAGADLRKALEAEGAEIDAGIVALARCFETLFLFPRPVVAAVNGHALAGGVILTCAADHRVMADGAGTIGAVELAAGVPFPAWALEVLRHAVHRAHFQEIVLFARAYSPADALRVGMVDEVVPADTLMERSLERAREMARVPRTTFALTKHAVKRWAAEAARKAGAETDEQVKAAWRSPEVKDAIKRLLAAIG